MNTLFEKVDTQNTSTKATKSNKIAVVKIKDPEGKKLSKQQQLFNRLNNKIVTLKKYIENEQIKLDKILNLYNKEIPALNTEVGNSYTALAKKIDVAALSQKLNKTELKKLKFIIVGLLNDAFSYIDADKDAIELFNTWSDKSYQEEYDEQKNEMFSELKSMIKNEIGLDIDFDEDMDIEDPEAFIKMQQKLADAMKAKVEKEGEEGTSKRKKSKKALEKEKLEKELEDNKTKSIRSIYIGLAKLLHPDTETNEDEKIRKQELMKRVGAAYENKDLAELLKIEMEIFSVSLTNIDKLTDEKIAPYIEALKDTIQQLQDEFQSMSYHPRYQEISAFSWYAEKRAIAEIMDRKCNLQNNINFANSFQNRLEKNIYKKEFQTILNHLEDELATEDDFDFDDIFKHL